MSEATTAMTATTDPATDPASFRSLILDDGLPAQDPAVTAALSRAAADGGEELAPVKAASLLDDPAALRNVRLFVLPSARSVPLAAIPVIDRFLRRGGQLIACGLALGAFNVF